MMPSPSTTSTMIAPKLRISNAATSVLAMCPDPISQKTLSLHLFQIDAQTTTLRIM
jgi:hypothetical protein